MEDKKQKQPSKRIELAKSDNKSTKEQVQNYQNGQLKPPNGKTKDRASKTAVQSIDFKEKDQRGRENPTTISYGSHDNKLKNNKPDVQLENGTMRTKFALGPMSMKNHNLAVHHIKIRKENHVTAGLDRGGLDSPFTLSEDGMPEGNYDDYSDRSHNYSRNDYNMNLNKFKTQTKDKNVKLTGRQSHHALQTSSNMLLDNSQISTHQKDYLGTVEDENDEWATPRLTRLTNKKISAYRPGQLIPRKPRYNQKVHVEQQPKMLLTGYDYIKRMAFHKQENLQIDAMSKWKKKDFKGMKKKLYIKEVQKVNDNILKIEEKTDLEKNEVYHDRYPFLSARRAISRFFIRCHLISHFIITQPIFDQISVAVILLNSVVMMMESPGEEQTYLMEMIDLVFTILYTVEMVLKIMGMGFVMNRGAYLRDNWNILDFFIVITSYIPILQTALEDKSITVNTEIGPQEESSGSFGFSSLRTFRVLRPLKTISSIQGLKVIMQALFAAMPLLADTLMILTFFFFVFSIAGTQLFSGLLKKRCVSIQTGKVHPEDMLCGGAVNECPGGYFCGKTNENPNYGVTNFDVIFYALLMVFQSVTLEGWSEIMVDLEKVFHYLVIWFFMILLVFIGAFFLLNLTLAVINSSFNDTHKRHQAASEFVDDEDQIGDVEADMEKKLQNVQELSIAQYITARVYAKKMVEFLRMRQRIKQIEKERTEVLKQKMAQSRHGVQAVATLNHPNGQEKHQDQDAFYLKSQHQKSHVSFDAITNGSPVSLRKIDKDSFEKTRETQENNEDVIQEEDGEQHEEKSDHEKDEHLKNIQNLIKNGKEHLLLNGQNTNGISTPKRIKDIVRSEYKSPLEPAPTQDSARGPGPKMMGNVGLTKQGVVIDKKDTNRLLNDLVKDLEIENVLGVTKEKDAEANGPNENKEHTQDVQKPQLKPQKKVRGSRNEVNENLNAVYFDHDSQSQDEGNKSGLITSDSDFDEAVKEAGITSPQFPRIRVQNMDNKWKQTLSYDTKTEVSKTFKRMLTQNYKRGILASNTHNFGIAGNSTEKQADSILSVSKLNPEFDQLTLNTEIENKYAKRKLKSKNLRHKQYIEDTNSIIQSELQDKFLIPQKGNVYKGRQRQDYRTLNEVINVKRPNDPFEQVNPLTHKVVINHGVPFNSQSQQEIFLERYTKHEIKQKMDQNQYIQLKPSFVGPEYADDQTPKTKTRSLYHPYQQKVEYEVLTDSSEIDDDSSVSPDDDDRCAEEQPYINPGYLHYKKNIDHVHINEIAKRSDTIISSTLSLNMIPKDTRIISHIHRVNMNQNDLVEYIDAKNSFKAMMKEYFYQKGSIRDKDKGFKDVYLKSFIHRQDFSSLALNQFKARVQELNKNRVIEKPKDPEVQKLERLKYEQNKKAIEKITQEGYPEYDLITIKKLLQGQAYEQPDENEDVEKDHSNPIIQSQKTKSMNTEEQDGGQTRLEKNLVQWTDFSRMDLRKKEDKTVVKIQDEIPEVIRKEFHIPVDMNYFDVNFNEIQKHDAGRKRLRPIWSGQDVLQFKLNNEKSLRVINQINTIRIWPEDQFQNFWKRFRYQLRFIIKSGYFESIMTFMVLLNSITLALERHGLQQEERDLYDIFDTWFTNIFIVEMSSKIIAIGIQKYLMDKMNWLDGSVVLISVFEIIYKKMQTGSTISLQGFRTLRLFRTLRVFRVMRVLRALKSMQMIVGVMAKSYMSFLYITMLMFLFIYIFALLSMNVFGATMNFPDGTPRSNYDSFDISCVTTFQILTMENWQQVLFSLMRSDQNNKFTVCLILMGWIFLGNFILLNLFLAILLDAFLEEDDEQDEQSDSQMLMRQQKMARVIQQQKKREQDVLVLRDTVQKKKEKSALAKMLMGDEAYESEDLEDLDEEQVIQIFKQQGIIKKSKDEQKEINLYMGPPIIDCQMSLYMFSKDNRFRQMAYRLVKHPNWDNTIIVLIILSSIKLAGDTYLYTLEEDNIIVKASSITDDIFNYSFIIEMCLKVIAMGLIMDGGSYLRESWNQLDFFIVCSSIVDMVLSSIADGQSVGFVKILRLLRVLRPLRMISRNPDLKLMVSALMESIGHILNVLVVIGIIYMIFAILGVNLMSGRFFYCSSDPLKLSTQRECELAGGQWMSRDHNFDDTIQGFNTLLIIASLEGWPDIFFYAADADAEDYGPKTNSSLLTAILFFLVYIMIGSFFLLNLFIGVLFVKFNQAKSENERGLKPQDLAWMDIQRLILSQMPEYETTNVPENPWRKYFHDLVCTRYFEIGIMSCIVLNMLQMALEFDGQSEQYTNGLKYSNYFFSTVFIIEATIKLIAFGVSYFDNGWNKFDFFVVTASIFDITLEVIGGSSLQGITFFPSLARVFRVLRVTRLFKLAGSLKGLQAIIQTIIFSISQLSNVVLLLFIILFMFTVLAVELFGNITTGQVIDANYKNFRNFHTSLILLLGLMTGEDWNRVMFDCSRTKEQGCVEGQNCGSLFAIFYFNGLIIVCSYVMLQLFILVIIQQFDKYYLSQDNTIKTFKDDLEKFYKIWKIFTQKRYRCYKIKENQLQMFFRELGGNNGENSLGFDREIPSQDLKKHILKMGIKSNNGYIFFNELLYRCMRKKFGSMKLNRQMQIFELRTQYNIFLISQEVQQKLSDKAIKQTLKKASESENIYKEMIQKSGGFNPFLTEMNYKITFKTWLKFARQRIEFEKKGHDYSRKSFKQRIRMQMVKLIDVEIEIQKEIEWTSEEEDDNISAKSSRSKLMSSMKKDKSSKFKTPGSASVIGEQSDEKSQKRSDHLVAFEKQMLLKFKNMGSMKTGSPLKSQKSMDVQGSAIKAQLGGLLVNKINTESKKLKSQKIKKNDIQTGMDASLFAAKLKSRSSSSKKVDHTQQDSLNNNQ